jgi:hypothetical protein
MPDFLLAAGQFLAIAGLIWGAILKLSNGGCVAMTRSGYDPVIGHDWLKSPTHAKGAHAEDPSFAQTQRASARVAQNEIAMHH